VGSALTVDVLHLGVVVRLPSGSGCHCCCCSCAGSFWSWIVLAGPPPDADRNGHRAGCCGCPPTSLCDVSAMFQAEAPLETQVFPSPSSTNPFCDSFISRRLPCASRGAKSYPSWTSIRRDVCRIRIGRRCRESIGRSGALKLEGDRRFGIQV
jgi:hypothetical protein